MSRIVNVNISRETRAVMTADFGKTIVITNKKDIPLAKINLDNLDTVDAEIKETVQALFATNIAETMIFGKLGTYEEVLEEVKEVDFYAILTELDGTDEVQLNEDLDELIAFANAYKKLVFPNLYNILPAELTKVTSREDDRLAVFYHKERTMQAPAKVVSYLLPFQIGSTNWALNVIPDLTTSLGDTIVMPELEKKVNLIQKEMGLNVTYKGWTMSGSYIDELQSEDWFRARITEQVTGFMIRKRKVPFTQDGISSIGNEIRFVLNQAVSRGIIVSDYSITVPSINEISTNDKANRTLKGIKVIAQLTGAVESITIDLTLEL